LVYAVDVDKATQALEEHADSQEEVADTVENTKKEIEKETKAVSFNTKKMVLWAAGAASVYRLYMRLRQAIVKVIREVYSHTDEMKELTSAWDGFTRSIVVSLVPYDEMLNLMDRMAGTVNKVSDGLLGTSAQLDGYTAAADAAAKNSGYLSSALQGALGSFEAFSTLGPVPQQFLGWLAVAAARAGILGDETSGLVLDNYDLAKSQREATNATAMAGKATEELTKKQEEAARASERYQQRIYQITEDRLQSLLQAHKDYYTALADMALADARRAEDLAIETARRYEDLVRDAARRRAALLRKYMEQAFKAERKYALASRRLADDRARRLLQIERRYQDKLLDIERSYSRSMYDAIATRDATAALQAMRKRKEDIVDAKRDRDRARADVESDYIRRLRDLWENLEEQRRQARKSYEDQLAELNIKLAEQEEDLALSLKRREEDARLSYQRQLQDLLLSLGEQIQAAQDQYTQDRRLANIEYRYREMALAAHLARMQAIWNSYQTGSQSPSFPAGPTGHIPSFADGGAMVVTGPTMMQFGEKGRELVIAQPLPSASQNVSVSGSIKHDVSAIIQQSIAGIEGRVANAVHSALAEIVR
jgi:hypothetical protein